MINVNVWKKTKGYKSFEWTITKGFLISQG